MIRRAAALTALLLTAPTLAVVSAAPARAAELTVDCTTGPVRLAESTTSYELVGACSRVTVSGSNVSVTFTSARSVLVTGSNDRLVGQRVGALTVRGANNRVRATTLGRVVVRGSNEAVTARRTGGVTLRGSNNRLSARRAAGLRVIGSNNRARLLRLPSVVVRGSVNTVVVKQGRTEVSVTGANNTVRVHRRR